MDSEKNPEEPTDPTRADEEALAAEKIRILNRILQLGWATGYHFNEVTKHCEVTWTPIGSNRLGNVRDTLNAVGCLDPLAWRAFNAILSDRH